MPVMNGEFDRFNDHGLPYRRKLFVRDKDGNEVEIRTQADLQRILDQMTPEQVETWKARYRFAPIENLTRIKDYSGTGWDLM